MGSGRRNPPFSHASRASGQPGIGSVWRAPGMPALILVSITGFGGFSALMSVGPLWVREGGSGSGGAGLVTGVLLASTVLTQTTVPWLLRRFSYAAVLTGGLVTLGAPSIAFGVSDHLAPILLLSAVRGIGFGILTVTGSTVVALLVSPLQRGRAVGAYGLAVALPNLALLPVSVAIAEHFGFWWVFGIGALPILGVPAALRLGWILRDQGREPAAPDPAAASSTGEDTPRRGRVWVQSLPAAVVLFVVTIAGGALMTFLPQMTTNTVAVLGLLLLGLCAAISRWGIGLIADRQGAAGLQLPLLLLTCCGLGLSAFALQGEGVSWLLLVAVSVVGVGFGAVQNVTLVVALGTTDPAGYGTASAMWNIGFDGGTAVGAVLLGFVAGAASFAWGFVVMAALVLLALPMCVRGWTDRLVRSG